ncbi:DsbA family protein, partial [Myxococcota bacterium]|nr:DsbA family protein [Myxococcota bacterium]
MFRHALLSLLLLFPLSCTHKPQQSNRPPDSINKEAGKNPGPRLSDSLKDRPTVKKHDTKITCENLFSSVGRCLIPSHENIYNIPIKNTPMKGAASPLVTIVEFSDLECPGCRFWATNLFPAILKKYPTDVALGFKHFPLSFHALAPMAAQALCAVKAQRGDTAFWTLHDFLYTNQSSITFEFLMAKPPRGKDATPDPMLPKLLALMKSLKINLKKYRKSLLLETYKKEVEADISLGGTLGVNQTPQVFLNGRLLNNHEKLEEAVERELARARALIAQGVGRSGLYTHISGKGTPILKLPLSEKSIKKTLG